MKKVKLAVLLLLLTGGISYAQNPFYDAVKLKNDFFIGQDTIQKGDSVFIVLSDIDEVYAILKKYVRTQSDAKDSIANEFETNPFLRFNKQKSHGQLAAIFSKGIQSIGGLDVTKFANAIADLMIERAKQELTVAFFDRFKKFAEDNPEFQVLFPKTTENLGNLLSYAYPQMLPALRNGFFEDLKQITYHLDDVLALPRYQHLLRNFPEVRIAIKSVRLVHEIENGASNAADIIREFALFDEWNDPANPKIRSVGSCLKIASLISESIRNDTSQSHTDDVWVSSKELKSLFYNDTLFSIYLGLLYQQSLTNNVVYVAFDGATKPFWTMLAEQKNDLFLFQNKLKEFVDLAGNVNTAYKEFKKKTEGDNKPSDEDIYGYINTSINVIDYAFSIVKVFHEKPIADNYLKIARISNNLYKSIYTKQYTQAVNDALNILALLDTLIEKQQPDLAVINDMDAVKNYSGTAANDVKRLSKGNSFLSRVSDKSIDNVVEADIANPDVAKLADHYNLKRLLRFINKLKPYALFMANMVEAKDENDVKAALENVILPVGSSSIKKNTFCNISVQTYLGAYWATSGSAASSGNAWSDKFGVIAPIGIAWTPGFLSWKKGGSVSLFGSLFDLGAIVDYKLKKDSTVNNAGVTTEVVSKDYKIMLGQIVSPGVYAVYGFGANLPLSLGFGGQYGPGLSKIDAGNNPVIANPSWRWNMFLAVDIPFFTLKNKMKNK